MEDPWDSLASKADIISELQPRRLVSNEVIGGLQVSTQTHPLTTTTHAHTHRYAHTSTHIESYVL